MQNYNKIIKSYENIMKSLNKHTEFPIKSVMESYSKAIQPFSHIDSLFESHNKLMQSVNTLTKLPIESVIESYPKAIQPFSHMDSLFESHNKLMQSLNTLTKFPIESVLEPYQKIIQPFPYIDSLLESHNKLMQSLNEFTKLPINSLLESIKYIKQPYIKYIECHYEQISKIQQAIEHNSKIVNSSINNIMDACNISDIIKNCIETLDDIDFKHLNITTDTSIIYQNEETILDAPDINNILNTATSKNQNTINIQTKSYKNISIKVFLFILIVILNLIFNIYGQQSLNFSKYVLSTIFEGFLNKYGEIVLEKIHELINNSHQKNKAIETNISIKNLRVINTNEVNVREFSYSKSRLVGKLYLNQCVETLEKVNYWTKVKYYNKGTGITIVGWVSSRSLCYINEETSTLTVDID